METARTFQISRKLRAGIIIGSLYALCGSLVWGSSGCGSGGDKTDSAPVTSNSTSTTHTENECVFYAPEGAEPQNVGEATPANIEAARVKSAELGGDVTINNCGGDVTVNIDQSETTTNTTTDTNTVVGDNNGDGQNTPQ